LKRHLTGITTAILALFGFGSPGLADTRRAPAFAVEAVALPAGATIVVDGTLNEEIWGRAPRINEFVQREPAEG
jgi:hypothetical protein